MFPATLSPVWTNAPFGVATYEPEYVDGQLVDMVLRWANYYMNDLLGLNLRALTGKRFSELSNPGAWAELKPRYALLIQTNRPFTFARTFRSPKGDGDYDYVATSWYSQPFIGLLIHETTRVEDTPRIDAGDADLFSRIAENNADRTLELVKSLGMMKNGHDTTAYGPKQS